MFSRSSQRLAVCSMLAATSVFSVAPTAQAGPVLDWLLNRGQPAAPAYPVSPPVAVPAGGFAAPNGFAPAGGFQQQVSSRVPVPSFGSNLNRAAVTYYRPVVEFDPVTGTNVTRMRPCTSYEYQNQRVPTLSARPAFAGNLPTSRFPTVTAPSFGTTPVPSQPSSANLLPTTNGNYGSPRTFARNRQFTPPAPYVGPSIAPTSQPTLPNGTVNYSSGFALTTAAAAPSFGFGQLRPITPNVRPSTARFPSGQIAQTAPPQNSFPQSWNVGAANPANIAAARPALPPQSGLIPVGPPASVTVPAYSGSSYGTIPAYSSQGTIPATSQFTLPNGQPTTLPPSTVNPRFSNAPLLPVPSPQSVQSPFIPTPTTSGSSSRPVVPQRAVPNGFNGGNLTPGFSSSQFAPAQPTTNGSSSRPAFQNAPPVGGSGARPISITSNRPATGYDQPSSNGGWEIDTSRPVRELGPISTTAETASTKQPIRLQNEDPKTALPPPVDARLPQRQNFGGNDPEANVAPQLDNNAPGRMFDLRTSNSHRDSILPNRRPGQNEQPRFGQRRADEWNSGLVTNEFNQADLGNNLTSRSRQNDFQENRFKNNRLNTVNPVVIDQAESSGIDLEPANLLQPAPIPNDIDASPNYNQSLLNSRDLSAQSSHANPYRTISRSGRESSSHRETTQPNARYASRTSQHDNQALSNYRSIDRVEEKPYGNAFLRPRK